MFSMAVGTIGERLNETCPFFFVRGSTVDLGGGGGGGGGGCVFCFFFLYSKVFFLYNESNRIKKQ